VPRLPVEICELVIDIVAAFVDGWDPHSDAPWRETLAACALTCRVWYAHAQRHRLKVVNLRGRNDVTILCNLLRDVPRLKVSVQVASFGSYTGDRLPLPYLGMFITKLALQLPGLHSLAIYGASWTSSSVRVDDLQYLQMFRHLTRLRLYRVTFTNASQLARLVAALPGLL
ncbi:hypothetical protein FOMPIDRAFT_1087027, partial [Fomitopsis schrenkii]